MFDHETGWLRKIMFNRNYLIFKIIGQENKKMVFLCKKLYITFNKRFVFRWSTTVFRLPKNQLNKTKMYVKVKKYIHFDTQNNSFICWITNTFESFKIHKSEKIWYSIKLFFLRVEFNKIQFLIMFRNKRTCLYSEYYQETRCTILSVQRRPVYF